MILSMQVEKLSPHLASLAKLLDGYQQSDPAFPDSALVWLSDVEAAMGALRLPEGSEMSALRGSILKSTDVLRSQPTGEEDGPGRSVLRSARNAAAAGSSNKRKALGLDAGTELIGSVIWKKSWPESR